MLRLGGLWFFQAAVPFSTPADWSVLPGPRLHMAASRISLTETGAHASVLNRPEAEQYVLAHLGEPLRVQGGAASDSHKLGNVEV